MRTSIQDRTCEVQSNNAVRQSNIKATPEMFRTLYSGLYSRKEMAIVREELANAWDGHKRAGTQDVAPDIHLPTSLDPWFEIRDYGTGLSPNAVPMLFDYGATDKNNDDEEIGGFGYGAKAPFCYTDQFTVISYYHGMAYIFAAFLQSDGRPASVELDRYVTDESNGLLVRVNVADSGTSHARFTMVLEELYPFLPVTPNLNIDATQHKLERPEYRFDETIDASPLYRVSVPANKRNSITFVQGIVPYPFPIGDLHDVRDVISTETIRMFNNMALVLWVDIGTLPVTASRENLQLDYETKRKAAALIEQAAEYVKTQLKKTCDEAQTWYEWSQAARTLPFNVERPDWIKQLTRGSTNAVDLQTIGAATDQTLTCTYAYTDLSLKDGFRRKNTSSLNVVDIEQATIYVTPKAGWPIRRFLAERHFISTSSNPAAPDAIILTGDINKIRNAAKQLGIPNKIHEVEYIKALRNSSQAQRNNLGAAKYWSKYVYWDANAQMWRRGTEGQITVQDYMDNVELCDDTCVVFSQDFFDVLARGLCNNVITAKCPKIRYLEVNKNHTRVQRTLQQEFANREIRHIPGPTLQVHTNTLQALSNFIYAADCITSTYPYLENATRNFRRTLEKTLYDAGDTALHHMQTAIASLSQLLDHRTWHVPDGMPRKALAELNDYASIALPPVETEAKQHVDQAIDYLTQTRFALGPHAPMLANRIDQILFHYTWWPISDDIIEELLVDLASHLPSYTSDEEGETT